MVEQYADLQWQKAKSSSLNGACVELAPLPEGGVAVRDSKDLQGPVLALEPEVWRGLAESMASGEFEHLIRR